jgi:radical SAM protein with 4Fe4S-binding SPASM domain
MPCEFLPLSESFYNVKKGSLKKCWKIYKEKRKLWNITPKECFSCDFKNSCNGGCKCLTFLKTGNYSKKDPYCEGVPPFCY